MLICFNDTPDPILLGTRPLHCLMYADDVILLSASATGLQTKLDRLNAYCKNWCLSVNTSKTKVLIFNKAGRHLSQKFVLNTVNLECVSRYKYLGIYFCASGSFAFAQKELYQKAQKSYFKLCKDFLQLNPDIKISLHVFDHTIKPILLYGSEIWGTFSPFTAKLRSNIVSIEKIYSKLLCEKLHLKFCKFILGVNKKSTNFGVLSELGRFPLHFNIVQSMLNYWYRLENLGSSFPLLMEAYQTSKMLFESKVASWYGSINTILKCIQNISCLKSSSPYTFRRLSKKYLMLHYKNIWHKQLLEHSSGKLCTYIKFKSNFGLENYLTMMKSFEQRRRLTRFRISAHRLLIELGRYQGTLRQDRICVRCTSGQVEDEKHFLLSCDKFREDRNNLLRCISKSCPNFMNLDIHSRFIWIMNTENVEILSNLSNFIKNNET